MNYVLGYCLRCGVTYADIANVVESECVLTRAADQYGAIAAHRRRLFPPPVPPPLI